MVVAAVVFAGTGLAIAASAGAAVPVSKTPSPTVISECGEIDGSELCGTPQWLSAAEAAAANLNSQVASHKGTIESTGGCGDAPGVTAAAGVALALLPGGLLVDFLVGTVAGVTAGELQTCGI